MKSRHVSLSMIRPTLEREVKALSTFHKLYSLNEAEIITYYEDRTIEAPCLTIHFRPLADWNLSF